MGGQQRSAAIPLSGWGRFPIQWCHVSRPETSAALRQIVLHGVERSYISRGLGRSYGDAALNCDQGVLVQTGQNRLLAFDPQQGLLECEAAVSLQEIIDVFLPRGWALPTTPGTKFVTVGGAIAADVHGKNHHRDGSFGAFVDDLQLLVASGEILHCSPKENSDIFWATIGGMGLTGCILTPASGSFRSKPLTSTSSIAGRPTWPRRWPVLRRRTPIFATRWPGSTV